MLAILPTQSVTESVGQRDQLPTMAVEQSAEHCSSTPAKFVRYPVELAVQLARLLLQRVPNRVLLTLQRCPPQSHQ